MKYGSDECNIKCQLLNCPINLGLIFVGREAFQNADGIVIFGYSGVYKEEELAKLLPYRSPKTLFYFFTQETPIRDSQKTDQAIFNDLINYTVSYRYDSDIYYPYGWIQPKKFKGERSLAFFKPGDCNS